MRDIVVAAVPRNRALRILDLGCGTGSLVFRLAEALPHATLTGIDISRANINAAIEQTTAGTAGRVEFETADYLTFERGPFDAIVTDGVLHLIEADTTTLVQKLARDLRPGGVLVCAMPFDCGYNRAFTAARRALRAIRSRWSDAVILAAARVIHHGAMDDEALKERVVYMYIPPVRMLDRPFLSALSAAGLQPVSDHPMPNTSPSQLRHRATVFSKEMPT